MSYGSGQRNGCSLPHLAKGEGHQPYHPVPLPQPYPYPVRKTWEPLHREGEGGEGGGEGGSH